MNGTQLKHHNAFPPPENRGGFIMFTVKNIVLDDIL